MAEQKEGEQERFCFVTDGDCHWYLAPVKYRDKAQEYFEACERYWSIENNKSGYTKYPDPGDEPEWLRRLDCVGGVSFLDPKEL